MSTNFIVNRRFGHVGRSVATFLSVGLAAVLSACGGGSVSLQVPTSSLSTSSVTVADVQKASANTAVVPASTAESVKIALDSTVALLTRVQAGANYSCANGGTAIYSVTGPDAVALANGRFDAGERYAVTFSDCKMAAGQASVAGVMTLSVDSASANGWSLSSSAQSLMVTLPRGTVTLNGSATVSRAVVVNGTTVTTTTRWQAPNYSVATVFGTRRSTTSLTAVDRSCTVVVNNGVTSSVTHSGSSTLSVALGNGTFNITENTSGVITYDANGLPTFGTWSFALPSNRVTVSIANGVATASVDRGGDGSVDVVFTFKVPDLGAMAG